MARQYAKISVSNYKFYNDKDELIANVEFLKSENIQYFADETVSLLLTNAVIDLDLKDKFREAVKLEREYVLRDIRTGDDYNFMDTYENISIPYVSLKGEMNDIVVMDIKVVGMNSVTITIPDETECNCDYENCTCCDNVQPDSIEVEGAEDGKL